MAADPQAVSAEALALAIRDGLDADPTFSAAAQKAIARGHEAVDALLAQVAEAERSRASIWDEVQRSVDEAQRGLVERAVRAEAEAERRGELLRAWLAKPIGAFDWSLAEQTRAALRGGNSG